MLNRPQRVAEAIREALQSIFQYEVHDPRLPAIFTITRVNVPKDLRSAKAYFSLLPDDEESINQAEEMLHDCKGFVRMRMAEDVNLKFAPELFFEYDPGEKNFQKVSAKLNQIRRDDEKRQKS